MKFSYVATFLLPALALAAPMPKGNKGGAQTGNAAKGSSAGAPAAAAGSAAASVPSDVANASTTVADTAAAQNNAAQNAASNGGDAVNSDIQFDINSPPNPQTDFDATTAPGDLGPFTPVRQPDPSATGGPAQLSAADVQRALNAVSSWSTDTTIVSNFLNIGSTTERGAAFDSAAHVGYAAEVDELTHKGILDTIIGNDPQVSVANLTLTNGVFQSVVNNLQVMSAQGKDTQSLIDAINQVRCTQVLPSIDTYMLVVNRMVPGSILKASGKPDACATIIKQQANNVAAFPNVPNVPGGTDLLSNADAQKGVLADSQGGAAAAAPAAKAGAAKAPAAKAPAASAAKAGAAKAPAAKAGAAKAAPAAAKNAKSAKKN